MSLTADIVFPLPLVRRFRYSVPETFRAAVQPGVRARAPLGRKSLSGFIVQVHDGGPEDLRPLKEIEALLDGNPVVTAEDIAFAEALSGHFQSSPGELLQAMLPPSLEIRSATKARMTEAGALALRDGRLTAEEKKVGLVLRDKAYTVLHLKRASGARNVSSVIRRMEEKGLITLEKKTSSRTRSKPVVDKPGSAQLELDFSSDPGVERAIAPLFAAVDRSRFASFYVFGGRVRRWAAYTSVIRRTLGRPGNVLVLVPELSLSVPLKDMVRKRLGTAVAFFHGQQPDGERESEWRRVREGAARIIIGPRSAVFSPLDAVGAVIVDDEDDDAFHQSESPAYDARYAARLLAVQRNALLISGSAVPSVEAFYRARAEGTLVRLPAAADAMTAAVIDDRNEPGLIARGLDEALRGALDERRPALIFLNRRGYASFLFCPKCGAIPRCDRCRVPLTYHKKDARLICRYGHVSRPVQKTCRSCGNRVLEPRGAGIEALDEELRRLFPGARVAMFDGDRIRTKTARDRLVRRFAEGNIDILAGTQLLAHRSDLPPAGFVGVLNPEALLSLADIQAGQRTLSTVRRMMGFTAAADAGGRTVIQTSFPEHHAILAASRGEYALFYDEELKLRRLMDYPPFSAMAVVTLYGREGRSLAAKTREFIRRVRAADPEVEVLGPAVASPSWPRGEKGVEVILRAGRSEALDRCLADGLDSVRGKTRLVRYD